MSLGIIESNAAKKSPHWIWGYGGQILHDRVCFFLSIYGGLKIDYVWQLVFLPVPGRRRGFALHHGPRLPQSNINDSIKFIRSMVAHTPLTTPLCIYIYIYCAYISTTIRDLDHTFFHISKSSCSGDLPRKKTAAASSWIPSAESSAAKALWISCERMASMRLQSSHSAMNLRSTVGRSRRDGIPSYPSF